MGELTAQRYPWEPASLETTVALLQRDMAYLVAYTSVMVHSNRPELQIIVNTARGQIVPRGECKFTDGSTIELQDLGMPQPGAPQMTVQELMARVWQIAAELGLELADYMLTVAPIDSKAAAHTVVCNHYLHRRPPISHAFGLFAPWLVGVVTFGTPASHHMLLSASPTDTSKAIELNRLWVHDSMPRNTESWFIARALKLLPPYIVLSYADTGHGHEGYVYRAANFFYSGWTDMERRMPRFDYVVPGKHSRDAFRNGFTERVRRKPKVKYWTTTGNRRERRELEKLCQWPKLNWKETARPLWPWEAKENSKIVVDTL